MNYYDALKQAAKSAGVALTQVGPALGKATTYVHNGLTRKSSPTVDNAAAMLAVCGWSLVAVPNTEQLPDTALVLDAPPSASPAAQAERKRKEAEAAERRAEQLRAEAEQLEQQ